MKSFLAQQTAATALVGSMLAASALHPFIHHIEGGTLDAVLDYLTATALDTLRRLEP